MATTYRKQPVESEVDEQTIESTVSAAAAAMVRIGLAVCIHVFNTVLVTTVDDTGAAAGEETYSCNRGR
jgi:hypothetical protein